MQCLRCVVEREHRKPFLQFFFVFFRQSCTVTALSSNMHLVVLSHRCVRTIWSVRKPTGPDAKLKRSVDLSLVRFPSEVCLSVGSGSFPTTYPPSLSPLPPLSCTAYVSVHEKAATGSAGKLEAAVLRFSLSLPPPPQHVPHPQISCGTLITPASLCRRPNHSALKHTKLLLLQKK